MADKPLKSITFPGLPDKYTIPSKVSELTNDAGYITSYTETDPTVPSWAKASQKPTYTYSEVGASSANHTHTYSQVGAASAAHTHTYSAVGAASAAHTHTAAEVGAVPTSRMVNGKSLNSNITLSASDVGALPTTTHIPADQVNADWNATTGVASILNKPSIPAAQVNANWTATTGVSSILNKPSIPSVYSDVGAASAGHTHTYSAVGAASAAHVHGSITSDGKITAAGIALANGDALVVTDSSASHVIKKTSITFDGSTTTKALTQKGTWETFLQSYTETDPTVPAWAKASSKPTYTYSEVGAASAAHTHTYSDVGAASAGHTHTAANVGAVPTSRTVNGKSLNSNITLTAADVGALPTTTVIPAAQVNSDWNATTGVSSILNKPSIPAAQVNANWTATTGVASILNKPSIPSTYSDVGASSAAHTHTYSQVGAASAAHTHTYSDVGASSAAHAHGNITSGGDITSNATIANGDRLVINDESASKIINSSITFGTSTTSFLANNGTWQTPAGTAQVNANWTATTGVASILNKPSIPSTYSDVGALSANTTYVSNVNGMSGSVSLPGEYIKNGNLTLPITEIKKWDENGYAGLLINTGNASGSAEYFLYNATAVNSMTAAAAAKISQLEAAMPSTYSDVGAASAGHTHTYSDVGAASAAHTHGNITNTGDMTATAAIANGDRLVINDESASKLVSSTLTFGTSTTSFLANNGTWLTPAGTAQVNANWTATTGVASILNKPAIPSTYTDVGAASSGHTHTYSAVGAASAAHVHGSITSDGKITATGVAIANGDGLVIVDSSDSSKIKKASITFGTNTESYLANDGNWVLLNTPFIAYAEQAGVYDVTDIDRAITDRKIVYVCAEDDNNEYYLPLTAVQSGYFQFGGIYRNCDNDQSYEANLYVDRSDGSSDGPYTSAVHDSNHYHGYVTPAGALWNQTIAIASGDQLVVIDASDSNKIKKSPITFGTSDSLVLANNGAWKSLHDDYYIEYGEEFDTTEAADILTEGLKPVYITYDNNGGDQIKALVQSYSLREGYLDSISATALGIMGEYHIDWWANNGGSEWSIAQFGIQSTISSSATNRQIPTSKAVYDLVIGAMRSSY